MTPIATKNNAIILKDGKLAEDCGCCGAWYCYRCEEHTSLPYSTTTFSDSCWESAGVSTNPLLFEAGFIERCVFIGTGDVSLNISASLSLAGTAAVATRFENGNMNPTQGLENCMAAGYAKDFPQAGNDRAQIRSPGGFVTSPSSFGGTINGVFTRRSGRWFVSMPEIGEVDAGATNTGSWVWCGITGTFTGRGTEPKSVSSFSITRT
jgi:hypothetical protein